MPPREPAIEAPAEPQPSAELPGPQEAASGVWHRVERGQTLWRIARAYGVPLEELARANGIDDPSSIATGTRLFVPGARATIEVTPYGAPSVPDPDVARRLPGPGLVWPVAGGRVLSRFGAPRPGRQHQGVDIAGRPGDPVRAVAPGRVVYSGSTMRGYGKTVIVDHGNGLRSLYAHGSKLLVGHGERVERGQPVALVGRTGNASVEHCHFELRRGTRPIDPLPYFDTVARR